MDLSKIHEATLGGTLSRELARMEEERVSWRRALAQTDTISKHMRELSEGGSTYARIAREVKAMQSPAITLTQHYHDMFGMGSAVSQELRFWQEAERAQLKHIQKMLDPLATIRKSLLAENTTERIIKELTETSSIRNQAKLLAEQATGSMSVAKMLAQQADASRSGVNRIFENLAVGSSIQNYLKDFERINKQWKVPSEVLGVVGSFKEIQEQLGKVSLPTIDWGSAGALAKILGQEGIEEQLAWLGIAPDGSMRPPTELPEKGILSRKQSDALALLSLLLGILFFIYQEASTRQNDAGNDAFKAQTAVTLQVQSQQIQALTLLIEKALVQAAQDPEDRFVVRERTTTVRSEPKHGANVEGKLLPNEVVRGIDRDGKWVEIHYYHWLHEEYRTGWVLKKYLERVPANHSNRVN